MRAGFGISAVAILIMVAACGASGGTPASSADAAASAAATETPSSGPSSSPQGVAATSCVPRPSYLSVPDGTRVDDLADGFAITLPHGWAQVDLASGDVVPAFSGAAAEPGIAAYLRLLASAAKSAHYQWLAVDLSPTPGGNPSAPPAALLVGLKPVTGATLDTIAASVTTGARGSGVTGEIQQTRGTIGGVNALELRFNDVMQDLSGREIPAVKTYYIALRGDTALVLMFSAAADSAPSEAAVLEAMARSLEFHDGTAPGCSLFAGLPYTMDLPGWLGGGPARWDAQIQSLTVAGSAPDKLAILKGFDVPIRGNVIFAVDGSTDLSVFVDSGAVPDGMSDQDYLNAVEPGMIAGVQEAGHLVTQPIIDRVTSPLGGPGLRIRYVTDSVTLAGIQFNEARVGYVFQVGGVFYSPFFTFPVSDNRYDEVEHIFSTFRLN